MVAHKKSSGFIFFLLLFLIVCFVIAIPARGQSGYDPTNPPSFPPVGFTKSDLQGTNTNFPTSLQFGPDDRLYVADQDGTIRVYDVVRNDVNDYAVTNIEIIDVVRKIPNFDDDGTFNPNFNTRLVTGLLVVGDAANPVIYVASSDPRVASQYEDIPLDTNSGILSMITQSTSGSWSNPVRLDLVRGIPRNKENHVPNGLAMDMPGGNTTLYLAQAGNTNMGAPSSSFSFQSEYALSASILKFDLDALFLLPTQTYTYPNGVTAQVKYDLPTLDDPDRPGDPDENDPFGGHNALPSALNQARLVPGGPVQIHAAGFRNPYDVIIASDGRMYTIDNGPNKDWGGPPNNEGPGGNCDNSVVNNSEAAYPDNLHYVREMSGTIYYAGHANPVRGNPAGIFASEADSPVPFALANPVECDYRQPGVEDGALTTWNNSTDGLAEYTASNFDGELQGDLLAAGWNSRNLYRVKIAYDQDDNPTVLADDILFSNVSSMPLDVITQGDFDPFPGTIWVVDYIQNRIIIFEPADFTTCSGEYNPAIDEDGDGYNNADELDNLTNPCNPADVPADNDGDFISDLNDPDDDNDGLADEVDSLAIDAQNGKGTNLPVNYDFDSRDGGILGLGFTGLMSNGTDNYLDLFDPENMTAGGAGEVLTIDNVPPGTAYGNVNNLAYGFQFGINSCSICLPFTASSDLMLPLQTISGTLATQAMGMYVSNGDQDNYLAILAHGNNGQGGIQVIYETGGAVANDTILTDPAILAANRATFYLTVNRSAGTVQPGYGIDGGARIDVGSPIPIPLAWLEGNSGLAVGMMATRNGGDTFSVTWDRFQVHYETPAGPGIWNVMASTNDPTARHENAFVELNGKFYLLGGRGNKPVDIYDPVTDMWTAGAPTPFEIHHFQAETWNDLIYVIGAMTGPYPNETPVPYVLIYDPHRDVWLDGPAIPRPRGSAGVVAYQNKLYMVGGIENGHVSGTQAWFDEFDPATNTWSVLPDAPNARDHLHATILDGKLIVAGGRVTDLPVPFDQTLAAVDVFDFATGTWSSPTNVPTQRAGAGLVTLGDKVVLIGGESNTQSDAHEEVEAYDPATNSWTTLADLPATPTDEDRHGTQAIVFNDSIYVAAGSGGQGGGPELDSQVRFNLDGSCNLPAPPAGVLTAEPAEVDFGTVPFGFPVSNTVVISHSSGVGSILVSGAHVVGADMAAFQLADFIPVIIDPGEIITVEVVFDPPAEGAYGLSDTGRPNAVLAIEHSGANSALTIPLSGATGDVEVPITGLDVTTNSPVALGNNAVFSATINTGTNVSYDWNFGDGNTLVNGPVVNHTYGVTGTFPVTVTAINSVSMVSTTTVMEIVTAPAFTLRINSGGNAYTDVGGQDWLADQYYNGFSGAYNTNAAISNTLDDPLYQSERYGNGSYSLPVPAAGCYLVRLHFAEIWFSPGGGGNQTPGDGDRVFDVYLENSPTPFLDNYDINADVGPETAVVWEQKLHIQDGNMDIDLAGVIENPKISAIEVLSDFCLAGDVDCDGLRDVVDALYIMQYEVGLRNGNNLCPPEENTMYLPACDVNGDSTCNVVDALTIMQCEVGIPNVLCPEEEGNQAGGNKEPARPLLEPAIISISSASISTGETVTVPVNISIPADNHLTAFTLDIDFDPAVVEFSGCQTNDLPFSMAICNLNLAANPSGRIISLSAIATEGITGNLLLGELTFTGRETGESSLVPTTRAYEDGSGQNPTLLPGSILVSDPTVIGFRQVAATTETGNAPPLIPALILAAALLLGLYIPFNLRRN